MDDGNWRYTDTGRIAGASSSGLFRTTVRDAWTTFWQDPSQLQCVSGAAPVRLALTQHWSSFAAQLAPSSRVLDLGCGAGAVARMLLARRPDVCVTGVDFAKVPLAFQPGFELFSHTAMEALPFINESFNAAISQFGFEYSGTDATANEMARVLVRGGTFSFLAHHAGSAIVAENLARSHAIRALLSPEIRETFLAGEKPALTNQLKALLQAHPHDTLVTELVHVLPLRLTRAERERSAIWTAIEDALAPERCILEELHACAIAPEYLEDWLAPLRAVCDVPQPEVLREPDGQPIGWRIEGVRR